jgi:hypothetical protein
MKRTIFLTIAPLMLATAPLAVHAADATTAPAAASTMSAPATSAPAADSLKPAMSDDEWQFGLTVPLWAPQVDGNVTVAGRRQNVNINFNSLRQHLDAVFSTAVEAHNGKYSFYGDVGYMKFSVSQSAVGPDGHVHVDAWAGLKFLYSDAAMGYQLIKTESDHPFILEGTAGVRYWYASLPVTASVYDTHGNGVSTGASKTWNLVDPVLGFRGSQYFTRQLHFDFKGDGGGFDLSHSTDWTWSAMGALSYDFCKYLTVSAGYQALALDESENGNRGNSNGVNLIFNGALVMLNVHW